MIQPKVNSKGLEAFCLKHHIKRLAFFGSVLRADFRPESDIDVLVEFDEAHVPGLEFFSMAEELEELEVILDRKVDLLTPGFLSPYIRDEVLNQAQTQYEA